MDFLLIMGLLLIFYSICIKCNINNKINLKTFKYFLIIGIVLFFIGGIGSLKIHNII